MTFVLRYWKQLTLAVILVITHGCLYRAGGNSCRADIADMRADAEKALAQAAKAETAAVNKARQAERAKADALNHAASEYERGRNEAQGKADAVIAGLRTGSIELRDEWAQCETRRVSSASASTAQLDASAEQRNRLAAEIVQIGAQADAQILGLQSVIKADRE